MAVSLVCFTGNALLLKHLASAHDASPWLALLYRAVIGFIVMWLLFSRQQGVLNIRRAATHRLLISRGILGALGTAAYYITVPPLGPGKATLIGNTWVIWSAVMAMLVLKERLVSRQIIGIATAIGGLSLLTGADHHLFDAGHVVWEVIAVAGALLAAATVVVIRQLTRTDSSATIFSSQCIYTALLALPVVIANQHHASWLASGLLILAASCAAIGQLAMTEGFRHLPVTVGGAFQVVLPLIITLGSVALFAEPFTLAQAAGAGLILLGGYLTVAMR